MIPLYTFVRGDVLGLVMVADERQTIAELAAMAQAAVAMRLAPWPRAAIVARGRRLDPAHTVEGAGLGPLDRIDVIDLDDEDRAGTTP